MFIIAEVGQAHEGSVGIAHSYIDALADVGVDAIKFQTHIAEAESSSQEPFRVKFSFEDKTRFDYWKRMEFTVEQWLSLKQHCEKIGVDFISSPFSNAAVDLLESIGVNKYKIGSGEVSNFLMLNKIAKTGKPIILSSGMSSYEELDNTIKFLKPFNSDLSILQCTTAYPTEPQNWGLNVISDLKNRYNIPVGFSDHSGDIFAGLAATSVGAEILEFHIVFDKRMFGPDAKSSLTINQAKKLVQGVGAIKTALKEPIDKNELREYKELKRIFEKSLAVNRSIKKGEVITIYDLEAKKPGNCGIRATDYKQVVGKKMSNSLHQWDFINWEDVQT